MTTRAPATFPDEPEPEPATLAYEIGPGCWTTSIATPSWTRGTTATTSLRMNGATMLVVYR